MCIMSGVLLHCVCVCVLRVPAGLCQEGLQLEEVEGSPVPGGPVRGSRLHPRPVGEGESGRLGEGGRV